MSAERSTTNGYNFIFPTISFSNVQYQFSKTIGRLINYLSAYFFVVEQMSNTEASHIFKVRQSDASENADTSAHRPVTTHCPGIARQRIIFGAEAETELERLYQLDLLRDDADDATDGKTNDVSNRTRSDGVLDTKSATEEARHCPRTGDYHIIDGYVYRLEYVGTYAAWNQYNKR